MPGAHEGTRRPGWPDASTVQPWATRIPAKKRERGDRISRASIGRSPRQNVHSRRSRVRAGQGTVEDAERSSTRAIARRGRAPAVARNPGRARKNQEGARILVELARARHAGTTLIQRLASFFTIFPPFITIRTFS